MMVGTLTPTAGRVAGSQREGHLVLQRETFKKRGSQTACWDPVLELPSGHGSVGTSTFSLLWRVGTERTPDKMRGGISKAEPDSTLVFATSPHSQDLELPSILPIIFQDLSTPNWECTLKNGAWLGRGPGLNKS